MRTFLIISIEKDWVVDTHVFCLLVFVCVVGLLGVTLLAVMMDTLRDYTPDLLVLVDLLVATSDTDIDIECKL